VAVQVSVLCFLHRERDRQLRLQRLARGKVNDADKELVEMALPVDVIFAAELTYLRPMHLAFKCREEIPS
jgi:hypothetical protein